MSSADLFGTGDRGGKLIGTVVVAETELHEANKIRNGADDAGIGGGEITEAVSFGKIIEDGTRDEGGCGGDRHRVGGRRVEEIVVNVGGGESKLEVRDDYRGGRRIGFTPTIDRYIWI